MNEFIKPKINSPFYFARKGLYEAALLFASKINGGNLLDFGCGSKPYKSLFNVNKYIGIDFENEGHSHKNENIDIIYDRGALPFNDFEFDYILCTEVLEHLFDIDEKLKEFNRVLKKDGLLFVTCPFVWNEHEIPNDYARYTSFALNEKFKKNNFDVVLFKKSGNFFETYFQIFFLYFSKKNIKYTEQKVNFTKRIIICLINFIGITVNKLVPNNESFYLSNVYILKKSSGL
jgi:ubiquinone/menaquinone biosynthesis C-methylase UbiE